MNKLGNKEIIATVELALNASTQYGLFVEYDVDGNPILKVVPQARVTAKQTTFESRK